MSIKSNTPNTAPQILAALGGGVVADPERRPHGGTGDDVLELLGGLLAVAELEAATRIDPAALPPQGPPDLHRGCQAQTQDMELRRAVLVRRPQRTAYDIGLHLDSINPPDEPLAGDGRGDPGPTTASCHVLRRQPPGGPAAGRPAPRPPRA
ncbi:hypothetical protein ACFW9I_32570 [[Kitasatospora] papulosa]|uniref:hypothetical protein n=1 Tax=[Kitasatospora] papulosa TaxID=1464011 RepID=UPI0036CCFD70